MSVAEVESPLQIEKNALGIDYNAACIIGTRLKEAREHNSFSKEYVAKKAKIRERYIDAIEMGDWDVLPPGLNGRGLVRLYAKELGVHLPEFEGFSNLQTIQAEKQSESLTQNNFIKKSRYQPAAEESAEIIKIVPRSQYKRSHFDDNLPSAQNPHPHDISSSSVQNKLYQTKTHHAAAIVTPKIADIIGLELGSLAKENALENTEIKYEINSNHHNVNVLPLAKPVHKPKIVEQLSQNELNTKEITEPEALVQSEVKIEEILSAVSAAATSNNVSSTNTEQAKIQDTENKPQIRLLQLPQNIRKIVLYTLTPISISLIIVGLYLITKKEHKPNSQPLSNSERHLIQKTDSESAIAGVAGSNDELAKNKDILATTSLSSNTSAANAIERTAKVDILMKVKLQIDADGKEVFSGYRQPGTLEFNFKDKAEILVYDASKVKLTYGTWEHGELGWNERKRKITLNAKPYED